MKLSLSTTLAIVALLALLFEESYCQRRNSESRAERRARRRRQRQERQRRRNPPVVATTPRPCPPIPHIDNGQGLDTGHTVQYACEPGFILEGTNVITCLNGRWTVAPRCRRQICPRPVTISFAAPPMLTNGGVTATYRCNAGYRIAGGNGATSRTIQCITTSQFWPNTPVCEPIPVVSCAGPPSIPNSVSTVSNNVASYACSKGYRLKAGTPSSITCGAQGWPTTNLPVCETDPTVKPDPVKCAKAPPCGDAKITREAVGDSYVVGSTVKYTCVTGHRIVGKNDNAVNTGTVTCKSDGTWTVSPTCEPVSCGVPPAGTNTMPVVAASIQFPGPYTYVCMANYVIGSTLESKCQADGKWSLTPPPTCTKKVCKASALKVLANADRLTQDVVVGGTITYTCAINYRIAPGTPTTTTRTQTVTCQVDGTFTALVYKCVYIYPESCRDYFARDNLFVAATTTCVPVTIDPQGPNLADPTNPPPANVQCCKTSVTDYCTQVSPSAGSAYTLPTGTTCAGTATTVMPGTTFTIAQSAVCDVPTAVTYPISDTQILSMIKSTSGTCSQATSINCQTATNSLALALRVNGEGSGFLYGTNALPIRGTDITLSQYGNAGAPCDCAAGGNVAVTPCLSGCQCMANGAVGASRTDTITKYLSAAKPSYVTSYQVTQHDAPQDTAANDWIVGVGPIRCCETF